jgi:hypothetical protein
MRIQMFATSLVAAAALVGCGGDDGIRVPDAKVFKDAAIDAPHICTVMDSLGNLGLGTDTMPRARQSFFKDMDTGTIFFGIGLRLNMDATPDVIYFIVDKPAGGTWMTNVPYIIQTDPTAMTAEAVSFLDGDEDSNGNAVQFLWPQPGTPNPAITFTMIGTANGARVDATINMTTYKEIDDMGNLVAGGCTSTLTGLKMYMTQNADAPTRTVMDSPSEFGNTDAPSGVTNKLSAEKFRSRVKTMKAYYAAHPEEL